METTRTKELTKKTLPIKCDIYQDTGNVILEMDMPGVTRENLDIQIDGNLLIVEGKKTLPEIKGEYRLREIRNGKYHHKFTIDDTIDHNKIDAQLTNGIVIITLGIKETEKPRKIEVNAN